MFGTYDKPCCGNCKYNRLDLEEDEYVCDNPQGCAYGCGTLFSDCCEDYERDEN